MTSRPEPAGRIAQPASGLRSHKRTIRRGRTIAPRDRHPTIVCDKLSSPKHVMIEGTPSGLRPPAAAYFKRLGGNLKGGGRYRLRPVYSLALVGIELRTPWLNDTIK